MDNGRKKRKGMLKDIKQEIRDNYNLSDKDFKKLLTDSHEIMDL